jgi:hypothetical protein
MALDPITLAMVGKTALSAGKAIKGAINTKKAKGMGAPLVDPNQQAMNNTVKRMLRARETGTSDFMARKGANSTGKMMLRKSLMAGNRSAAPYLAMMNQAASNIAENASRERLGLLSTLTKGVQDVADRKMDLLEQDKAQTNLQAQADKTVGEKNLWATGAKLGDILMGKKTKNSYSDVLLDDEETDNTGVVDTE